MEERQRAGEEKKHTRVQREGAEGTAREKKWRAAQVKCRAAKKAD